MGTRRFLKIFIIYVTVFLCGCRNTNLMFETIKSNNDSILFYLKSNNNRFYGLHRITIALNETKDYLVFSEEDVNMKTENKQIVIAAPCDSSLLKNNNTAEVDIDFGRISVIATINIENNNGQLKFFVEKQFCSFQF